MGMIVKGIAAILAAGIVVGGLAACEKKEGPVERAGKAVDKAVDNAGKKIENAGDKVQDAARDAKK